MACRSLLNRILQGAEDERLIPANPVGRVPPPKRPVDPEVIFGRVEPRVYTPKLMGHAATRRSSWAAEGMSAMGAVYRHTTTEMEARVL